MAGPAGPGLAVLLTVGSEGAIALLPESSGLLPEWYQKPDATGTSKLATLAQELGMLLTPEQFLPDAFCAAYVPNLGEVLTRANVHQRPGLVGLVLDGRGRELRPAQGVLVGAKPVGRVV